MDKNKVLEIVAKEKGVQEALLQYTMDTIAFHESKGKPTAEQTSGGPGRGLYQYEIGDKASAASAKNRALHFFKKRDLEAPEWLTELPDNYNPAELDSDKQDMLFLTDHMERPNSDFALLKEIPIDEWWGKFHQTKNDPVKRERFIQDQNYFNQKILPKRLKNDPIYNATQAVQDNTYKVERGDTIYSVAQKAGVSPQQIMKVNGINDPKKLLIGMTLKMPKGRR